MVSAIPVKVIDLPPRPEPPKPEVIEEDSLALSEPVSAGPSTQLDWLSQPLSGRTLAWTVDVLVVVASVLLFTLIFLSVTREAPPWPFATAAGTVLLLAGMYRFFFSMFGGGSLGAKLARITEADREGPAKDTPFR